jgi:hypothetical protein
MEGDGGRHGDTGVTGGLTIFTVQFAMLRKTTNTNPAKDFCWWDLGGVCLSGVVVCLSVQW